MSALRRHSLPVPMTGYLTLFFLVALPIATLLLVAGRIVSKRKRVDARVAMLLAPFEKLPHGCFRHDGRVYRLLADVNPVFSRGFNLRLSTFAPTTLDFEIRAARNVPTKTPQKLAEDRFYKRFVLDSPAPDEAVEHLLAAKDTLARAFPSRWGAYSKYQCELVLSANTAVHEDLAPDLAALTALAAVPAERRPRGGTWTIREGFEEHLPAWHWKPEQRARLPDGTRRWCVSAWYDNAYLNRAICSFLWTLGDMRVVTLESDLWFLEHAFGRAFPVVDNIVQLTPEMAVAADQWLDGDFFAAAVAGVSAEAFHGAIKFDIHDHAIAAKPDVYVRRLFDDEFSWFSGEYEIVSATLSDDQVRSAFEASAKEHEAVVKQIERPFSFKLLKEDRLDLSF